MRRVVKLIENGLTRVAYGLDSVMSCFSCDYEGGRNNGGNAGKRDS